MSYDQVTCLWAHTHGTQRLDVLWECVGESGSVGEGISPEDHEEGTAS